MCGTKTEEKVSHKAARNSKDDIKSNNNYSPPITLHQPINQSINTFITRHGTEARATVRIMPKQREMSLKPGLKCVNRWSRSTVQRKRVPESWSSNGETTSSSVQVLRRNWQKLLCGRPQRTRLTVWADQISKANIHSGLTYFILNFVSVSCIDLEWPCMHIQAQKGCK